MPLEPLSPREPGDPSAPREPREPGEPREPREPHTRRESRRVLITGVTGQDGHYLAGQLLAEGSRVFGLVRGAPASPSAPCGVELLEGDLRDESSLRRAIDAAEPDEIYNLAAITFVPDSWQTPELVDDVNAGGARRLAAALLASGARTRLCHASSAEIFGAPTGHPLTEGDALAPVSPYGLSKAEAHRTILRLREEQGLFACSAILFNHESPRRPPSFVTRKVTMAAARIARGLGDSVTLGNLDAARDWGYAPEYMEAMRRMASAQTAADYIVATGRAVTVREFTRLAFARVGLDWQRHVKSETSLQRAGDIGARIGDPSRIARDLGWKAATSVEELVAIMVDADLALLDA